MKYLFALAGALAVGACASAPPEQTALPLHVGGRASAGEHDGQHAYTYTWPGVYFEARFAGPAVGVETDDDENDLYLYVDGTRRLILPRAGRQSLALTDLGQGEHTVRLEKVSETQGPTGRFLGFHVPDGNALPPPGYDAGIEFIGDSFTVGYGNASTGRDCTGAQVRDTTDTSLAFGPLAAKQLGADYRIVAASGFGVVRNYDGGNPGLSLPEIYDRMLFDVDAAASDDGWHPDVIVIGLGTNDFSTPLNPGERWQDREALRADYRDTYVRFVEKLHGRTPAAHFVLTASADNSELLAQVEAVHAELARRGTVSVSVLAAEGLDLEGCHYHPSARDHAMIAGLLVRELAPLLAHSPAE